MVCDNAAEIARGVVHHATTAPQQQRLRAVRCCSETRTADCPVTLRKALPLDRFAERAHTLGILRSDLFGRIGTQCV